MTEKYFTKFPIVPYANTRATDLTRRAEIIDRVEANPFVFYPYDVTVHERPEQFSTRYYDDPHMVWLVFLANDMIDPYHDWPLSDREFKADVMANYGSVERAIANVVFYRNNWYENADEEITTSRFESMDVKEKKYWEPAEDRVGGPRRYRRKRNDWILNTNAIVRYTANTPGDFEVGEPVTIRITADNTGNGIVVAANDSHLTVQHVQGTYLANNTVVISNTSHVEGRFSSANTRITSANLVARNIDPIEEVYWSPVRAYDKEVEENARNRSIRVLDARFGPQAALDLKRALSSNT